ncbi:MAG: hypothetical protein PHS49_03825 [Candidatus Gracilibacteria bacterium]|nr:hypothetical protein [Candidatus Gracilibacteria bacterium]
MSKGKLIIESVNPKNLGEKELIDIAKVEKDLWAYGIGEYVKCNCCGLIHSKNDIFGHLSEDIKMKCVSDLEEILMYDSIKCKRCDGDTEFVYDIETNVLEIKKRLFGSKDSFISKLVDADNGDTKGFVDGYIDNLENIFEREFSPHYGFVGYDYFKNIFEQSIGNCNSNSNDFFTISSLGTLEDSKSLVNILNLFKEFIFSIPDLYDDKTLVVEFDTGSIVHSIFHAVGFNKLPIENEKKSLINNTSDSYRSDLYYCNNMVKNSRTNFSQPLKQFIKTYSDKMREVLIA